MDLGDSTGRQGCLACCCALPGPKSPSCTRFLTPSGVLAPATCPGRHVGALAQMLALVCVAPEPMLVLRVLLSFKAGLRQDSGA